MRKSFGLVAAIAMVALAQSARAEDAIPGGEERFKFFAGGILARISSSVGVNGTVNEGTLVDLDGTVGNKNATSFLLGAKWRFASRHRLSGTFFQTTKDRALSFNRSVTIGDETLVPPATLESSARNRFVFATYEYSFVKNENVELSGLLGAYVNRFTIDLAGNATVVNSNGQTTINKAVDYRPAVTVPMPLIGASVDWYVAPGVTLGASLSGLKAKVGKINGSVYVATVSGEYMFTRNIGAGVAYMHTDANVDVTQQRFDGHVNWKNDNILLYAALKF